MQIFFNMVMCVFFRMQTWYEWINNKSKCNYDQKKHECTPLQNAIWIFFKKTWKKIRTKVRHKMKITKHECTLIVFLNENEHKANKRKLIQREKLKLIDYSPAMAPKTCWNNGYAIDLQTDDFNCNKNTASARRRFVECGKYGSIRRENNNFNFTQSN